MVETLPASSLRLTNMFLGSLQRSSVQLCSCFLAIRDTWG